MEVKHNDISIIRQNFSLKSTIGHVYLGFEREKFCYSLEDVVRGEHIKIPKHTAIPSGTYKWHITYSNRFKRDMISVYTEPNGYELISKGVSFKGIRIHGGNTHENTEGCPLVAFNRINNDTIQGTAEKELLKWARSVGGHGNIHVRNC